MKRVIFILSTLTSCPSFASDCMALDKNSMSTEAFLEQISGQAANETFDDDPIAWLETKMSLQKRDSNPLLQIKKCVELGYGFEQSDCRLALAEVSHELFRIKEDLDVALVCRLDHMSERQKEHISHLADRCHLFHHQLLQNAHRLDWFRAMQKSEREHSGAP